MYDSILIGSGPIMLLEALHLEALGKKVLIVEKDFQPGGAWKSCKVEGYPDLEIGCHIWDIDQPTQQFLANYLNLPLEQLKPQPKIHSGNLKVPYDWKNLVFMAREALGGARSGSIRKFGKALKKGANKGLSIVPKKYVYPIGGARQLMDHLNIKLEEEGIEMQLNCQFQEVAQDGDNLILQTSKGEFKSHELVLTSFSQLELIEGNNTEKLVVSSEKEREWIHYHLLFKDSSPINLSYVRLMRDPLIHRISDITNQVKHHGIEMQGKRMILVGVHASKYHQLNEDDRQKEIVATLQKHQLIGSNAELQHAQHNIYRSRLLEDESRLNIENLNHLPIRLLPSVNLIYGMAGQLHRWKPTLG